MGSAVTTAWLEVRPIRSARPTTVVLALTVVGAGWPQVAHAHAETVSSSPAAGKTVRYVSLAAIVGGLIAGIVIAHRLALRDAPGRAPLAGVPMVALMVGYTVLSPWIIASPIVIEPGVQPAAVLR